MARTLFAWLLLMAAAPAAAQEPPRTDGWVVLSLDEYRALRARAFPSEPPPAPPPVDVAITRIDYDLRADGDTVAGEARLAVDVLKQGWVAVAAPAGVLVRGARLDGRPTPLVSGSPPKVLVSRTGRAVLSLDVVVPISASNGTESMTLPASGSAVSAVRLVVPRANVELTSSGAVVAEQSETANESRWIVYGTPGRPITFLWRRKADDRRATMPLRTRGQITELVALGEDSSQITASVRTEVVQGAAKEVVMQVPEGVTVNQVSGGTVADWTHQAGSLTVIFLEPVTTDASFVVTGETRAPRDGTIAVPILRMPAAEWETGGIAVDVIGAGEINDREARGLDAADPTDLGDLVRGRESPSMAAFRFKPLVGSAARSLTVQVARYTPQAVLVANIEEARYDVLLGEDGKVLVRARYAVRNNQRGFLAVALPESATLWSAALSGRPARPGLSPAGSLLLPLAKGRAGENAPLVPVEVVYVQRTAEWSGKGATRLELPSVDLPVSRTGLTVRYSPRFELRVKPGAFRVETDPGPWNAALRSEPESSPADPNQVDALTPAVKSVPGALPVLVPLPRFGASVFVATELTEENKAPALELEYKRTDDR